MDGIIPRMAYSAKQKFLRHMHRCRNGQVKTHYLIISNLINHRTVLDTAKALGISRTTVYNVARRFSEQGEIGLLDHREDNGPAKVDDDYLGLLYQLVSGSPQDYGWPRPTWTRELLAITMQRLTGVKIHVTTMSRALKHIHARRGRPRPTVRCPWSKRARTRRITMIRRITETLPKGHIAVYEDELDVHLNPKIGLDWMVPSQQKSVLTPGQNKKRYIAGAMNARTGKLVWVQSEHKNSNLFIDLLRKLRSVYPGAKVIHVILDNFRIHTSMITTKAIEDFNGRFILHFLPPYCPQENRIERVWQDLHANVTRNHRCPSMKVLIKHIQRWLRNYNRRYKRNYIKKVA